MADRVAGEGRIPEGAVEAIAIALRHGHAHDGSEHDQAVDDDALLALSAALSTPEEPSDAS